jgi:hypothetical protein
MRATRFVCSVILAVLPLGSAWGADPVASKWLHTPEQEGGLNGDPDPEVPASDTTTQHYIPDNDPQALSTMMNAYYFLVDRPGGGGIDLYLRRKRDEALKEASDMATGPNADARFRAYQTSFLDNFDDFYQKAWDKGLRGEAAYNDAVKADRDSAKQFSESAGGNLRALTKPDENVPAEILAWAKKDRNFFGGGFGEKEQPTMKDAQTLADLANKFSRGEDTDRGTSNKQVAIRNFYAFARAPHPAGGLGYWEGADSKKALEWTKKIVVLDHAVTRVELFKDAYRKRLLLENTPGTDFDKLNEKVIGEALEDAKKPKIVTDANGAPSITGGGGAGAN